MTHWRFAGENLSSLPIDGSATFTMAMSSTTMNWAAQMAASANHRRGSATAPSGDGAVRAISIRVSSLVQTNRGLLLPTGRGPASFPPAGSTARGAALYPPSQWSRRVAGDKPRPTVLGGWFWAGRGRAPAYGTASPGLRD